MDELSNTAEEEYSKNYSSPSSEETDDNMGSGGRRSYECVFCKRGFTTAQALGGHMNIHRKHRVANNNNINNKNKVKSNYHGPSTSSINKVNVVGDDDNNNNNYDAEEDLLVRFYSPPISTHLVSAASYGGNDINNYYYCHHHEVDTNNNSYHHNHHHHHHQFYFPSSQACGSTTRPTSSNIENHQRDHRSGRDLFGQDYWKQNLSLYSNPNKIEDNRSSSEEGGLDLELRLGHYP